MPRPPPLRFCQLGLPAPLSLLLRAPLALSSGLLLPCGPTHGGGFVVGDDECTVGCSHRAEGRLARNRRLTVQEASDEPRKAHLLEEE